MKKNILFILFIFLFQACFREDPSDNNTTDITVQPNILSEISPALDKIESLITGNRFYIDQVSGDDTVGDGSSSNPWKSLDKAISSASGGDGIYLKSGNYGTLTYNKISDKYIVIQAEKNSKVEFSGVNISPIGGELQNISLILYGINVNYNNTDGTNDGAVNIRYAKNVRIYNCDISGKSKYSTEVGVYPTYSEDIIVANCNIYNSWRGISYTNSNNLIFYYNHIHKIAGSAIHTGSAGSDNIKIIGNHIHDSNYDLNNPECPQPPHNPHGSGISIRNSNMVIRNNIIHDGFNTAGITFYDDGAPVLSNILIENNLVYDIRNFYTVRVWNAGENIIFRNNTIVGHYRYPYLESPDKITSTVPMRYDSALLFQTVASGYEDKKGVSFYNNIFFGCFNINTNILQNNILQKNNIFYSFKNSNNKFYNSTDLGNNSTVLTTENSIASNDLIAEVLFSKPIRFDQNYVDLQYDVKGHGEVIPFTLAENSIAVNYGDSLFQSLDSLGSVNSDGFITPSILLRDKIKHDAGAYQN